MKTANELVFEFPEQNMLNLEHDAVTKLNGWGIEAAAMLRSQAKEIEQLKKERDALKADAERLNYLQANPGKVLRCHKNRWSLVALTSYPYPVFKTIREAIDAAMEQP